MIVELERRRNKQMACTVYTIKYMNLETNKNDIIKKIKQKKKRNTWRNIAQAVVTDARGQLNAPPSRPAAAPPESNSARAVMVRTCISKAEIQSVASSRRFGNETFRQPGTNRLRTRAFFCTAGNRFLLSPPLILVLFNPVDDVFFAFLCCVRSFLHRPRIARLHRVRPLAVAARIRSAVSRTWPAADGLATDDGVRRRASTRRREQIRCSASDLQGTALAEL